MSVLLACLTIRKYSPDQDRDEAGRWTDGGGGPKENTREAGNRAAREARAVALREGKGLNTAARIANLARRNLVNARHGKPPGKMRGPRAAKPADAAKPAPSAPKEQNWTSPRGDMEERLVNGKITETKKFNTGNVNVTKVVTFEGGHKAIFKPASGEVPDMRPNIDAGQMAEREVGAYQIAKIVGMDDLVPATSFRTVDGERGSIQEFRVGEPAYKISEYEQQVLDVIENSHIGRMAAFDYVIGNTDRHMANWMVSGSANRPVLIDHGLAFPESVSIRPARGFMRSARSIAKDTPVKHAAKYTQNKQAILSSLKKLGLPSKAVKGVSERIDKLGAMQTWADMYYTVSGDLRR